MKPTAADRGAIRVYQLRTWWYTRGPWTQIFIAAGLLCAFELALVWRIYPLLEKAVTS